MEITRCANLDCECTEVAFHFRELMESGQDAAKALVFHVRMAGQMWEEIAPPSRSAEVDRLVQEFLRDYPPGEREAIQRRSEEKLRHVQRLREYRIDLESIEDGALVAFGEILYDRKGGKAESASFFDSFEHAGERYYVDDLYCPNPDCLCNEVHLFFFRRVSTSEPGGLKAENRFLAKLSLDGRADVVKRYCGTPSEAKAVLSTWQEQYGSDLEELRWRYEKVKEIARRSVPRLASVSRRSDLRPREPAAVSGRIGRNDPCPCGSGKKFKKCCGQNKDILPRPR